ncbi:BlaI/MecI/CopY family transcriptional regulator [Spirosoma endbachense]|uniref:BlaI/MecI/CopY family transcriptional regulator n=1 Tax=Spirosoma endbachense TaxID=2666025 RepID=A0A6P1VQW9_9BACT|nr:BlaI/MecI/CopY family transcriptional regulator [Spirosoma endbachense]QHV95651.1 BlaI/MecI/CopY family transcriptional regulator [Spirosoma endbachense]
MSTEKNKSSDSLPTKGELEALKVLWKHGPSTVRFVHDLLTKDSKTVRYTSTLKMMQLMTEKGMLKRDESKMTHVYYALLEEKPTMATIANRFIQSMYNGSVSSLLVAFMDNKKSSAKEIEQVKAFLEQLDNQDESSLN